MYCFTIFHFLRPVGFYHFYRITPYRLYPFTALTIFAPMSVSRPPTRWLIDEMVPFSSWQSVCRANKISYAIPLVTPGAKTHPPTGPAIQQNPIRVGLSQRGSGPARCEACSMVYFALRIVIETALPMEIYGEWSFFLFFRPCSILQFPNLRHSSQKTHRNY